MKKIIALLALLVVPMMLMAQDTIPTDPITPPAGWEDILMNPGVWFASFTGVTLLTAFLATFVNGLLKFTEGFKKQLIAWAVAIILVVGSDLINFGYAKDYPILFAVINGFFAGLASNGWFDIPLLKAVLNRIEQWFVKPVTPIE
jgi:hypothetical protein